MSIRDILLLASITMNVLLVFLLIKKEKESAKNSPFAKDWPHQGALEVMTIPCEAVTLCADYIIPAEHADTQMKNEVITELAKTLYTQAIEFMDVKIQDDPLIYGTKIRGRLVVYKRRD
jgi:hypothetical protein